MNEALIGELTPEQIQELKNKFKGEELFSIECNGHIAYFKHPNRVILNSAMKKLGENANAQPLDYFEDVARDTKIGGTDDFLTNDNLFMNMVEKLKDVLSFKEAKLVKL